MRLQKKSVWKLAIISFILCAIISCSTRPSEKAYEAPSNFTDEAILELGLDETTKARLLNVLELQKNELDSLKIFFKERKRVAKDETEKEILRNQEREAKIRLMEKYLSQLSTFLTTEQISFLKSYRPKQSTGKEKHDKSPEEKALDKKQKLTVELSLDEKQQKKVYSLALEYEKKKAEIKNRYPKIDGQKEIDIEKDKRKAEEEKLKNSFKNQVRKILTKEQAERWEEKEKSDHKHHKKDEKHKNDKKEKS